LTFAINCGRGKEVLKLARPVRSKRRSLGRVRSPRCNGDEAANNRVLDPRLPVLRNRPNLDRAAEASRRNSRGQLDRRVEVFSFKNELSTNGSPCVDEGSFFRHRLVVLYAHRGCVVGKSERESRRDAGRLVYRLVPGVDPLLFFLRERFF